MKLQPYQNSSVTEKWVATHQLRNTDLIQARTISSANIDQFVQDQQSTHTAPTCGFCVRNQWIHGCWNCDFQWRITQVIKLVGDAQACV